MSLKLKSKFKNNILFDTVENRPSAFNYGKHGKYERVNSSVGLYNSQKSLNSVTFEDGTTPNSPSNISTPRIIDEGGAGNTDRDTDTDIDILDKDDDDDTSSNASNNDNNKNKDDADDDGHHEGTKFGTFDGVLGRCLLCMWGVIMFLRTGWIVGNAGVWQATLVMILSASITMFTTLSLSAICTNGEISHGGPYFLISRSLGPQYGGVIGLLFAVGNCVGVALHLVGFSEAIVSLYYPKSFFGGWDIQFYAEIGLLILFAIALRGVGSIIKFNLFLLFLMFVSIIAFFIGTFIWTSAKRDVGFTGYSSKTFAANWGPAYMDNYNFLTMVAIFFPSVTGCMAGANISGDLKKPSVNIPVGTISAVIFSMVVYVIIAWVLGATVVRELIDPDTGKFIPNTGLYHNYVIMSDISLWRPLVDIGIYASTFSSATSCFVAAPRIFKAVCDDGLFPIFSFFAVGRKSDNEPVRCYILVVIICGLIMISGDINFIAPMVTNFFLITYALVNYSVFAWDISKSPGWRPSFKYYSPYLSLFATLQSLVLMFLIDWITALVTAIVGGICYIYIGYRDIETNWGTTVETKLYSQGCKIALKYQKMNTEHAKITRPTFLILLYQNNQNDVSKLFNLAKYLNFAKGLIFIGNVIIGDIYGDIEKRKQYQLKRKSYDQYKNYDNLSNEILNKCIFETTISDNYEIGTKHMLSLCGMGGFKPNVCLIKMVNDDIISDNINDNQQQQQPLWFTTLTYSLLTSLGVIMISNDFNFDDLQSIDDDKNDKNKTIDIWWLFDDGGLTILTGYLLTKHKRFKNYKLRVCCIDDLGFEDSTEMAYLMNKLRINADIEHINTDDIKKEDEDEEEQNEENGEDDEKEEISEFAREKIIKYKRVGKIINDISLAHNTKLCLITMPYPRKKFKWFEYKQIINHLTPKDISTLFIRGTQEQVLTYNF